jgi:hypothetical protein
MPRRGEAIQIGGLELKVMRADRRRIETLRVTTQRDPDVRIGGRRLAGARRPPAGPSSTGGAGWRCSARCWRWPSRRSTCTCWRSVPGRAVPAVARTTPREAAWRGFLFTGGTFLAGTYWLYHSIHLVGQAPLWIALLLMLGLVAIMASYTAAIGYVAIARWARRRRAALAVAAARCSGCCPSGCVAGS